MTDGPEHDIHRAVWEDVMPDPGMAARDDIAAMIDAPPTALMAKKKE